MSICIVLEFPRTSHGTLTELLTRLQITLDAYAVGTNPSSVSAERQGDEPTGVKDLVDSQVVLDAQAPDLTSDSDGDNRPSDRAVWRKEIRIGKAPLRSAESVLISKSVRSRIRSLHPWLYLSCCATLRAPAVTARLDQQHPKPDLSATPRSSNLLHSLQGDPLLHNTSVPMLTIDRLTKHVPTNVVMSANEQGTRLRNLSRLLIPIAPAFQSKLKSQLMESSSNSAKFLVSLEIEVTPFVGLGSNCFFQLDKIGVEAKDGHIRELSLRREQRTPWICQPHDKISMAYEIVLQRELNTSRPRGGDSVGSRDVSIEIDASIYPSEFSLLQRSQSKTKSVERQPGVLLIAAGHRFALDIQTTDQSMSFAESHPLNTSSPGPLLHQPASGKGQITSNEIELCLTVCSPRIVRGGQLVIFPLLAVNRSSTRMLHLVVMPHPSSSLCSTPTRIPVSQPATLLSSDKDVEVASDLFPLVPYARFSPLASNGAAVIEIPFKITRAEQAVLRAPQLRLFCVGRSAEDCPSDDQSELNVSVDIGEHYRDLLGGETNVPGLRWVDIPRSMLPDILSTDLSKHCSGRGSIALQKTNVRFGAVQ